MATTQVQGVELSKDILSPGCVLMTQVMKLGTKIFESHYKLIKIVMSKCSYIYFGGVK